MATTKSMIEGFENRFNDKINQAKIYPTWAVVGFIIIMVINIALITFITIIR